jgi:hypothetical protein
MPRGRREVPVPESGDFACPRCLVDREYELLVVRETTGILGRYLPRTNGKIIQVLVNCHTCGGQFPGEIRDRELYRNR